MRPETLHIQPDLAGPYSTIPFILRPHITTICREGVAPPPQLGSQEGRLDMHAV